MLSHKYRFHGHGSLKHLFKNGKFSRNHLLQVRVSHNIRRVHPRVAVIVSKKVSKKAVVRNAIRRRLFELARRNFDELPAPSDIVFTVYSLDILTIPYEQLEVEVMQLLQDATRKLSDS